MKGSGLSQADKLLLLIEQASERGLFFMAQTGEHYVYRIKENVLVAGSGDAAILRSLERKGWIKFEPKLGKYACQITEDGKLKAQTIA